MDHTEGPAGEREQKSELNAESSSSLETWTKTNTSLEVEKRNEDAKLHTAFALLGRRPRPRPNHDGSLAFYVCVRYLFVQEMSMLRPLRLSRLNALGLRCNSTASPATPPLMAKIRTDLKTAMRAKETSR